MRYFILGLLIFLSLSCISKKTHQAQSVRFERQQDSLQSILQNKAFQIDTLQNALSFARGGNEALFITQDRLQNRLDELQLQIDQLNQNASSTQSNLGGRIQILNTEINTRQEKIDQIKNLISQRNNRLNVLQQSLQDSLINMDIESKLFNLRIRNGQLVLSLNEDLIFSRGSTSRIIENGKLILEDIVDILNNYPEMKLHVIGHTDSEAVRRQSLDNWQYSALRAVSVVKFLTDESNLSPSRVLAGSKGKFEPRASNETAEGRTQNRRIDLLIFPSDGDLERDLLRLLD